MSELSESILRLKAEGKTYRQIQDELGCSKSTISYHLGAGQKEKNLQRKRDRRSSIRKYLQEVRQKNPCADCGENYPYWMMQFDHLPEYEKSFNICTTTHGFSIEAIQNEINKCEVVCANCHANRTHYRVIRHGGDTMDLANFYE